MATEVQLLSNVKVITTGNKPTTENLLPGQAAFGKITSDGKYHLFGNSDGEVVDIVVSTVSDLLDTAQTLEQVLTTGNTTTLSITFDASTGNTTIISHDGATVSNGTRALTMKAGEGFRDGGFPVLSSNPANTIGSSDQNQMRTFLDVFNKAEVQALLSSVYKFKGSKESFTALISDGEYTPEVGDVWNIETAGGQDSHGQDIKAGDNIAFVGPKKATDWDILAGVVDLTNYYTKTEVDGIKTNLETKITEAKTQADKGVNDAAAAKKVADTVAADYVKDSELNSKLDAYVEAKHIVKDEDYVHTDNNFDDTSKAAVDTLKSDGDGSTVLADDGTYKTIKFSVVEI